jgi:hypothetical protein
VHFPSETPRHSKESAPKGRTAGRPKTALTQDGLDADLVAKRMQAHRRWEKRIDAWMERIYPVLVRAKRSLKMLSADECDPAEGDARPSELHQPKLSPSEGTKVPQEQNADELRGLTDWPREEWELTPLPEQDSGADLGREQRHGQERAREKKAGTSASVKKDQNDRSGKRGVRRCKHLRVKLRKHMFLDRSILSR